MFRASHITSEDALPILSAAVSLNESSTINEEAATNSSSNLKNGTKQTFYGVTTIPLPPLEYKYPLAVVFILLTKFFEAFAANGIRTVLALYLRDDLAFSENFSTIMLHIFNFFGQFCPIFGAILADSYIGNVRTIYSCCFLYAFGWVLLILTSLPNIGISVGFLVSISLLLIAIGNGSVRACITSLGALQFKLPEQAKQLAGYFSLYYFVYYFGVFLSKLIPPWIRVETNCFGKTDCYSAVFGVLGVAFLISWVTFAIGKFYYKPEKLVEENILIKFYGCIKHAISVKWKGRLSNGKRTTYWLHNAIGRYDESLVNDVAKVLKISKLFIPLPIYFALLAQQDSSWTFQASQMNTTIGDIEIQPDQAKAMGPIFLFILIPLWQYICSPIIKYIFGTELQPLYSITVGGIFSTLSFICAGVLEEYILNQPENSINIFWQIPQFVLIMMGELLLSIPGLQFAFTHAPPSMKSVVTAGWFLNNAFGNLLVVFITQLNMFTSQSSEYFFYAILMLISTIIFALLAYDYILQERAGNFYTTTPVQLISSFEDDQKYVEPSTSKSNEKAKYQPKNLV